MGPAWLVVASRCSLSTISQEEGGLLDSSSVISTVIYYVSTPGLWQPPHQLALLLFVVQEPAGRAAEPQPAAGTLLASLLQGDRWYDHGGYLHQHQHLGQVVTPAAGVRCSQLRRAQQQRPVLQHHLQQS